ncbi:MAG: glycolate oxidase subunit GlcE [Pseudomonadota bacterium]|nr:glycolate oxidase subunit GlcE [Pseudomonadota bacterium]
MKAQFTPQDSDETSAIVVEAVASDSALEIVGNGSRSQIGRPMVTKSRLSTAGLVGVLLYEPEELVLRVGAGTTLAQINHELEQHSQMLAFEPPDLGPLLGARSNQATIGGIIGGNLAGPRRIKVGAARDHFLGVEAISGRGEAFKSGGRVVKNVTGYDLCKLMAGSWGTLGIMTEVTLKVLPAPEKTRTILVGCKNAASAVSALTVALSSPHDVSGAAWVPSNVTPRSRTDYVSGAGTSIAAVRIEGIGISTEARTKALREEMAGFGTIEELHTHNSVKLWKEICDVRLFGEFQKEDAIWKISVPPATAPDLLEKFCGELDADAVLDWGGGLIWLHVRGMVAAGSDFIRKIVGITGGHATLVRATEAMRLSQPVFQPEPTPVARLTRNLKQAFDPKGILNPGRMYKDI